MIELRDDRACRAIVLTGEGRGFCVGADLGALEPLYAAGERPKLGGFLRDGYNELIPLLTDTPKPVVAAVNGIAAGAGLSLALACDIRVASEDSSYLMAFVRIGLVPDSGAAYLLPRTVAVGHRRPDRCRPGAQDRPGVERRRPRTLPRRSAGAGR
jgi:2-(1,2-epoxy-1,2-dihydrophenyl)acetyl-CoA isomerase